MARIVQINRTVLTPPLYWPGDTGHKCGSFCVIKGVYVPWHDILESGGGFVQQKMRKEDHKVEITEILKNYEMLFMNC